jgi:hypothetical protein
MLQLIWAMVAISAAATLVDAFLARELSQALVENVVIGYAKFGLSLSAIIVVLVVLKQWREKRLTATRALRP